MPQKKILAVLVVLGIFWWSDGPAESAEQIGNKLHNLKLTTLAGEKIRLHDAIKDKIAVIVFTTTWCLDCQKLDTLLSRTIPRYRNKEPAFCYVYVGQKKELLQKAHTGNLQHKTILLDEKRKASKKIQLKSVPHLIITDRRKIIRYAGIPRKENDLIKEIEKVINNPLSRTN